MSTDFSEIKIPFLTPKRIEEIADDFRLNHWGSTIPVNVDYIIEENLNMDLRPYLGLEKTIGILAFMPADQSYILYDYDQSEARIRYSISHELGHFVLHKKEIQHLRPTSIDEWKNFILNMPDSLISKVETQANMFASYLLIPREHLVISLEEMREEISKALKIIGDDYETLIDFLTPHIARKFDVTRQAMYFRLKNFELDFKEIFK